MATEIFQMNQAKEAWQLNAMPDIDWVFQWNEEKKLL